MSCQLSGFCSRESVWERVMLPRIHRLIASIVIGIGQFFLFYYLEMGSKSDLRGAAIYSFLFAVTCFFILKYIKLGADKGSKLEERDRLG